MCGRRRRTYAQKATWAMMFSDAVKTPLNKKSPSMDFIMLGLGDSVEKVPVVSVCIFL